MPQCQSGGSGGAPIRPHQTLRKNGTNGGCNNSDALCLHFPPFPSNFSPFPSISLHFSPFPSISLHFSPHFSLGAPHFYPSPPAISPFPPISSQFPTGFPPPPPHFPIPLFSRGHSHWGVPDSGASEACPSAAPPLRAPCRCLPCQCPWHRMACPTPARQSQPSFNTVSVVLRRAHVLIMTQSAPVNVHFRWHYKPFSSFFFTLRTALLLWQYMPARRGLHGLGRHCLPPLRVPANTSQFTPSDVAARPPVPPSAAAVPDRHGTPVAGPSCNPERGACLQLWAKRGRPATSRAPISLILLPLPRRCTR